MLTLETKRKIRKLDTIARDMWGKTGRITEVRGPKEIDYYPGFPEWLKARNEESRKKIPIKYFLRFWVPNRCVGLWLTEEQMEEV